MSARGKEESATPAPVAGPSVVKAKPKRKQPIIKSLSKPNSYNITYELLNNQLIAGDIDLSADYQRDVVWTEKKQESLINSIFTNCYVPPILFATHTELNGEEKKLCMDGKQRITSVHNFLASKIGYLDEDTGIHWYWPSGNQSLDDSRDILDSRYQKQFKSRIANVTEYTDITDEDQRDIFARVQLGEPLKTGEKMAAGTDNYTKMIKDLARDHLESTLDPIRKNGLQERCCKLDRGADFLLAAAIAISIFEEQESEHGPVYHTSNDMKKTLAAKGEGFPDPQGQQDVQNAMAKLTELSIVERDDDSDEEPTQATQGTPKKAKDRLKLFAPVPPCLAKSTSLELMLYCYFIYKHKNFTNEQYLTSIANIRSELRGDDDKNGTKSSKANFDRGMKIVITYKLGQASSRPTVNKRARPTQEDEDLDGYQPPASQRKSQSAAARSASASTTSSQTRARATASTANASPASKVTLSGGGSHKRLRNDCY